jgi:PAS domain S-box-containing protein
MQSSNNLPLYNSRLANNYVNYLKDVYPDLDIDHILKQSGMTAEEVADTGHWFSQDQVDRFQEVIVANTGDRQISRHAGRHIASGKGKSDVSRYLVGFVTIETVYASMAKLVPMLTRGAGTALKKLGSGRMEIVSTPLPGVKEKRYQCENRKGIFEGLPKPFTGEFAHIDHPECVHDGGACCRYIVTWNTSASFKLRLIRNYSLLVSIPILLGLAYGLPHLHFWISVALLTGFNIVLLIAYLLQKVTEQDRIIATYHRNSQDHIQSANTIYNNALLVQEIGQATAAMIDKGTIVYELGRLMKNRLDFDRGLILLADEDAAHLMYSAGYGYSKDESHRLKNMKFGLDNPDSRGLFVEVFKQQQYAILDNIRDISDLFSPRSQQLVKEFSIRSILCVPIVFGKKSLGILAVDNNRSEIPLKKSDINLLQGIASHIAISLYNARSFKKLKESENRYRQTVENITEGYFEINFDYKLIFTNKALCELLGCTYKEMINSRFDQFFIDSDIPKVQQLLANINWREKPIHFASYEMKNRDGRTIPVDLSASLVLDTEGRPIGFRGLARNATERLQLEKEKKSLENQLVHAQKMEAIGTLAGGVAHNFNNWLSGILGNATLIKIDSRHNHKLKQRAEIIERIVENAAKMTQQLLGYARGGKYKVDVIDVNTVIQEAASTFRTTRKDIHIDLQLEPELAAIKADKSQIEQILWNLYVNAVDAMPGGGKISIRSGTMWLAELSGHDFEVVPGHYVRLSITDAGTGIDAEHIDEIFDPFFTTKNGKGTGLGLASVYGIVKAHKGYIDVKSEKDKGSTFDIYLPSIDDGKTVDPRKETQIIDGNGTILIVDDENDILETVSQMLTRFGYDVMTGSSGKAALDIYKKHHHSIDLVILDMIMPEMGGSELYPQLKQIDQSIKVLLSSGYNLNKQTQNLMDLGCDGFIQKPYSMAALTAEIGRILDR